MAETLSYESAPRAQTPETKTGAFPALETRLADMPELSQDFSEVQAKFGTLVASSEKEKIEKSLRDINDNTLDEDVKLCLSRAKKDIQNILRVQEISQTTDEKVQTTDEKVQTSEKQEALNTAQERIQAVFKSFGDEEQFKKLNPKFDEWIKVAEKSPELDKKDPDYATKVQLLAIHEHRSEIDTNAQQLTGDLRKNYNSQKLFRDIESSLVDL